MLEGFALEGVRGDWSHLAKVQLPVVDVVLPRHLLEVYHVAFLFQLLGETSVSGNFR